MERRILFHTYKKSMQPVAGKHAFLRQADQREPLVELFVDPLLPDASAALLLSWSDELLWEEELLGVLFESMADGP
jgi:hypothetical protein